MMEVNDEEAEETSAKLVNVHWRPSQGPPKETEIHITNDSYMEGVLFMVNRWDHARSERIRTSKACFEDRLGLKEAEAEPVVVPAERSRRRRHTVFSSSAEDLVVEELQYSLLVEYFQARAAAVDMGPRQSTAPTEVSTLVADSTHQRILDIMVRTEAIKNQEILVQRGEGGVKESAVDEILEALLRCDFSRITSTFLSDFLKITSSYPDGGQSIISYVESRGEDELNRLEHPHINRLLYGLMCIPSVSPRLECMIYVSKYEEDATVCKRNLGVLLHAFSFKLLPEAL